jgi:hypothetical protein
MGYKEDLLRSNYLVITLLFCETLMNILGRIKRTPESIKNR